MAAYSNMPNIEILELTHEYVKFMLRNTDSSYAFPPPCKRDRPRECVLCVVCMCVEEKRVEEWEREKEEREKGGCMQCV